jgi:UDP-2-acetamido-3-amino-2,3-dideoxy-glucuronate N-acetyltransferase
MPERLSPVTNIKVAVVGMGYWGKNLVRNFHELGALATICDSDTAVERSQAEKYSNVSFCTDYHAVLADTVSTPWSWPHPRSRITAWPRRPCSPARTYLLRKPLAIEVSQGAELQQLAVSRGRILMIGHILRYHPAVHKLQELVATGGLGKIHYLYSNRLNIGKIRAEENILWSFAPHDISVVLALLNEQPMAVTSHGEGYLNRDVYDVTLSEFHFASGVRAHIFVSWLHPVKEQRLVIIGSDKMAVFDDTAENKLVLYPHRVEWKQRVPTAIKAQAEIVPLEALEPLREECLHFLDCVAARKRPVTDGEEGLRVLRVLDACQRSLANGGVTAKLNAAPAIDRSLDCFVHPSACVDSGAEIGAGTRIWHYSHIMKGAEIGERCLNRPERQYRRGNQGGAERQGSEQCFDLYRHR